MSVGAELLELVRAADARLALPPVSRVHLPPTGPDLGLASEFGVVVLADGSAGFFFTLLGDTAHRLEVDRASGAPAVRAAAVLAEAIVGDDPVAKAVGLGAASAVSQHVFSRAGLSLPRAASSLGGLEFEDDDHVGMVGLFPSLAARLRERRIRLTAIELRPEKVTREEGFEVTLDADRLRECNKVICTASALLNDTLDAILERCRHAERVAVIGPTASCFPDPLFSRGVQVVGGTRVVDAAALLGRLERNERWGDAVMRYTLTVEAYPGFESLVAGG